MKEQERKELEARGNKSRLIEDNTVHHTGFPTYTSDESLVTYKESMRDSVYKAIEKAFKRLYGGPEFGGK